MFLKLLDPVEPSLPRAPLSGMMTTAAVEAAEADETPLPGPEDVAVAAVAPLAPHEATADADAAPPQGSSEMKSWPELRRGEWSIRCHKRKEAAKIINFPIIK